MLKILLFFAMTAAHAETIYPRECYCSAVGICRPVSCGEISPAREYSAEDQKTAKWRGGYSWAAKNWTPRSGPIYGYFTAKQVRVSPDGQCHVCIYESGSGQREMCIFIPNASS